ncbi:GAF domain-containing sensor histidine kinase [Calothrix rhizosoleniae]|uniref:GAF domain-containing sensor histidine kinase n=1 Tax=Calothrix rhizosoleniae TaxID=888997 RepID=UPI000B4A4BF2|nr:GAF domain-containing sensor histidine kinase [Calothrix rhizosoleniae]
MTQTDSPSFSSSDSQRGRRALTILSNLSYRTDKFNYYLREITFSISELLQLDWSVVTLYDQGYKILASNIELGDAGNKIYSLHGSLTGTVVETGKVLAITDATSCSQYGSPPPGYQAYLGIPLCTPQGKIVGTICCFHKQPRLFTSDEIEIAELFAERVATAIDNYQLYQQQLQFNHILEIEVQKRTKELQTAQAKLVEKERLAAIGEFSACIVHEIRNPLTTIKMGLNSFKKLDLSAVWKERLSLAFSESERLERLLTEILLYAKPQTLKLEEINLNNWISQILPPLREMPEATDKFIEFSLGMNAVIVQVDKDKLQQILINIVRNGLEATSVGNTVQLLVSNLARKNQICIHVHNSGEPIPPEVLPQLTQPFFSTKTSGTGLGLAICKRIVELHGGELEIQSNSSEGTTVTVKLPLCNQQ